MPVEITAIVIEVALASLCVPFFRWVVKSIYDLKESNAVTHSNLAIIREDVREMRSKLLK